MVKDVGTAGHIIMARTHFMLYGCYKQSSHWKKYIYELAGTDYLFRLTIKEI